MAQTQNHSGSGRPSPFPPLSPPTCVLFSLSLWLNQELSRQNRQSPLNLPAQQLSFLIIIHRKMSNYIKRTHHFSKRRPCDAEITVIRGARDFRMFAVAMLSLGPVRTHARKSACFCAVSSLPGAAASEAGLLQSTESPNFTAVSVTSSLPQHYCTNLTQSYRH